MTWGTGFDWLDGTVTVPASKPAAWGSTLDDFYRSPNDGRWGRSLCRVLYHESTHFWQLLSSAYLANLVQAEWMRLRAFEDHGQWPPVDDAVAALRRTVDGRPFSAVELMECWARYWDVHTRHAGQLLREDGIPAPHAGQGPEGAYSGAQFDRFMQHGRDAAGYARPYRWALQRAGGASAFVNLVLPTITFCAFGSPDPVAVFTTALESALDSSAIRDAVHDRTGFINVDWLARYRIVIAEAVAPAVRSLGLPAFTAGWDVMARGRLGEHPVYETYLHRVQLALETVQLFNTAPPSDESMAEVLRAAAAAAAVRDPLVVFMFPGQPSYREHLGRILPPPRVRFTDTVWHAEIEFAGETATRLASHSGHGRPAGHHLDARYPALDRRLQRFRDAEYAVRRGLPLATFQG